jgi:hypothetical protein
VAVGLVEATGLALLLCKGLHHPDAAQVLLHLRGQDGQLLLDAQRSFLWTKTRDRGTRTL